MEQQAMSNLDIARHLSGQQSSARKKKYVNIDTRLFDIVNNYDSESETLHSAGLERHCCTRDIWCINFVFFLAIIKIIILLCFLYLHI